MCKKKKNVRKKENNIDTIYFCDVNVLSDSERDNFPNEQVLEVDNNVHLVKPFGPVTDTVYVIDFSDTNYRRILKHLVPIAFSIRGKYKCRTFCDNSHRIYVASTVSIQEMNIAMEWAIGIFLMIRYSLDRQKNNIDPLTKKLALSYYAKTKVSSES